MDAPLATLQAWLDESGKGDPTAFVVGGFVASVGQWARFSKQWQAVLDEEPKLSYFKMNHALSGRGVFTQFSEHQRLERVTKLIAVINRNVQYAVACVTYVKDYYEAIRQFGASMDHPFLSTYMGALEPVIRTYRQLNCGGPIDFIFDSMEETLLLELVTTWRSMKASGMPGTELLGNDPIMREDREFLPLQAADLMAGFVRRGIADRLLGVPPEASKARIAGSLAVPTNIIIWNKASLIAQRDQVLAMTPGSTREDEKARSARLKPLRKFLRDP